MFVSVSFDNGSFSYSSHVVDVCINPAEFNGKYLVTLTNSDDARFQFYSPHAAAPHPNSNGDANFHFFNCSEFVKGETLVEHVAGVKSYGLPIEVALDIVKGHMLTLDEILRKAAEARAPNEMAQTAKKNAEARAANVLMRPDMQVARTAEGGAPAPQDAPAAQPPPITFTVADAPTSLGNNP